MSITAKGYIYYSDAICKAIENYTAWCAGDLSRSLVDN